MPLLPCNQPATVGKLQPTRGTLRMMVAVVRRSAMAIFKANRCFFMRNTKSHRRKVKSCRRKRAIWRRQRTFQSIAEAGNDMPTKKDTILAVDEEDGVRRLQLGFGGAPSNDFNCCVGNGSVEVETGSVVVGGYGPSCY
ncbi:UNVERIFIED_CONTAM: hypothetical protein Sindi_1718100 [Sesamum indicum]